MRVPIQAGLALGLLVAVVLFELLQRRRVRRLIEGRKPEEIRELLEVELLKSQLSVFGSLVWPVLVLGIPLAATIWMHFRSEERIAHLQSKSAVVELTNALAAPDLVQRLAAVTAISQLGSVDDQTVEILITIVTNRLETETQPAVLRQLTFAAGRLPPEERTVRNLANANRRAAIRFARACGVVATAAGPLRDRRKVPSETLLAELLRGIPPLYEERRNVPDPPLEHPRLLMTPSIKKAFNQEVSRRMARAGHSLDSVTWRSFSDVEEAAMQLMATGQALVRCVRAYSEAALEMNKLNLSNVVIPTSDWAEFDFGGANLTRSFLGGDFTRARLDGADLAGCVLVGVADAATIKTLSRAAPGATLDLAPQGAAN